MTTLALNTPRAYEQGDRNEFGVKASTKIYEGAAVGIEVATGYARPLVAGDVFVGFALCKADNSAVATNGAINVQVIDEGKVELAVGSLAITDLGKSVYASDDATFTLTMSTNSLVGRVVRYVSSGVGVVEFASRVGGYTTSLTDSSGGSATDTIAAIGATYAQSEVRDAVASLTAKVNFLLRQKK